MSAKRLRRFSKIVGYTFGLCAAITLMMALAIQYRIRVANAWQGYAQLPNATVPTRDSSIIVFAPHNDDETLGCGGLLALAHANGAQARVVVMTNGDAYWYAASRTYKTISITSDRLISFACRRQQETLNALNVAGVDSAHVTFLGYPDRGLSVIWNKNWNTRTPYTSPNTGLNYSPYANSLTPHATYCGESVLKDIASVLRSSKPTDIYVPHPLDNHPDHYATYCFVVAAVAQLRSEGADFAAKLKVHTYLVHRGDWPVPRGEDLKKPLVPPYAMASGDTQWKSLMLPPDIAKIKREAIRKYESQVNVSKEFLMSFARSNELFGEVAERGITEVQPGKISVDGDSQDWAEIPPVVIDPVGDYVVAGMNEGADVRAIYACTDGQSLFIRIDCANNLLRSARYTLTLRGIQPAGSNDYYTVSIKPQGGRAAGTTDWAYKDNVLEMAVPLDKLKMDNSLFVQVQTNAMNMTVDNTGWHELDMPTKTVAQGTATNESSRG